jgi:hypothetical protein
VAGNTPGPNISKDAEAALAEFVASFFADPYGFVMAMYPWGQPTLPDGSPNILADRKGPEPWQRELLEDLGAHIRQNIELIELGLQPRVFRSAIASGHDVGKSAIVAWLIQIFMSTRVDTRGAVTASTQFQLEDKTWPELAKWHKLLLNKHWFKWSATTYSFAAYAEDQQKNYRTTAATVSKDNTEAFAGLHNEGRTVFVIFDEASGVDNKIWEVSEGALMDGEAFFFAFGNPTKPEGEFADCFDKNRHLYRTRHIDSRTVSHTNKSALAFIVEKYGGEDTDQVKVRIRGLFPENTYDGFMDATMVRECMQRETALVDPNAPLYMAVDVANKGGDEIVIGFRQGWNARLPRHIFTNVRHKELLERVTKIADIHRPDIIIVECVGMGIPMCDDLEDLGYRVFRAYPGALSKQDYYNMRTVWWAEMRDWIYEPLSAIDNDEDLFRQLTTIQYKLRKSDGKTLMESKDEMRERGLPSPDRADMLMLTFAVKLPRRDLSMARHSKLARQRQTNHEYDPLTY